MSKSISLTTGPLPGHIRRITMPMSIGLFFNTMYNVVDSFYAGQVSTEALAALALSFPVFFIIISVSEGIARGSSALIANAIGERDEKAERDYSVQVFSLGAMCAVFLMVIGTVVAEPLFRALGAEGTALKLAKGYVLPLFYGSPFFLLSSMSNAILLAHGDSKTYGKVLVGGFFLNLVLDPWFLYGGFGMPALGVPGIAWATVLIQALGGVFLFVTVQQKGHLKVARHEEFRPQLAVYRRILRQGIPTSFNMMSIALGFFVTTYFLKFYDETAIAAFGVGTRIEQIALLPAIGLSSAIVSIVGQNYGAGQIERVRECVRLCVKYGFTLIGTASILLVLFAEPLVDIFTDDPEVIEVGTTYIRIVSVMQWAYVMTFIHLGFLQALKRPMYGFVESVVRKIILPLSFFPLLVVFYKVSLVGFWWGMVGINISMTLITIFYAHRLLKKIAAPLKIP